VNEQALPSATSSMFYGKVLNLTMQPARDSTVIKETMRGRGNM
jgi:hypothetical protein